MNMRTHQQAGRAAAPIPARSARTQAPITLGDVRDPLEHEADRLAARLVAGGAVAPGEVSGDGQGAGDGSLRRCPGGCDCHSGERTLQRSPAEPVPPGDGPAASGGRAPGEVEAVLARPGGPLGAADRAYFEPRLGADLGDVRVRTGPDADRAARSVGARAFTVGSDIVLDRASGPLPARHVLAHELVHVVQRRGLAGRMLRRTPAPAPPAIKEEVAREAVKFLDALRVHLSTLREQATVDLGRTPTLDIADRVAGRFNQTTVQAVLARGKSIYEAQHLLQQPDAAVVGELRAAYARLMHEVRLAADEALRIAYEGRFDVRQREEPRYGETLARWLEASGFRNAMLAGRTAFTPAEAAASTTYEGDLTAVLAGLPWANLAQPAIAARLADGLVNARSRVAPDASGHPRAEPLPAATITRVDGALEAVRQVRATVRDGVALLDAAAATLTGWLAAPADPATAAAGAALQRYFRTNDPEYAALVRDRLRIMSRELSGGGSLYLHLQFAAAGRQTDCDVPSTLGASPVPYEIVLCRAPNPAQPDKEAITLLHELAHAVVPGRGTRERAGYGDRPLDRAYEGERLMVRMATEEALSNAQSYAELILVLAGRGGGLWRVPADTTSGCGPDDAGRILDAVAWAQTLSRRAITHIAPWQQTFQRTGAYEAQPRERVTAVFGGAPTDAEIDAIFTDMTGIHRNMLNWLAAHAFTCEKEGSKLCPAGAVGATSEWIIEATAVRRRAKAMRKVERSVCPAFHQLTDIEQRRVALALVVLHLTSVDHPENVLRYARLAQDLWDIDPPPAAGLADHRAADARLAPQPPPPRRGPNP